MAGTGSSRPIGDGTNASESKRLQRPNGVCTLEPEVASHRELILDRLIDQLTRFTLLPSAVPIAQPPGDRVGVVEVGRKLLPVPLAPSGFPAPLAPTTMVSFGIVYWSAPARRLCLLLVARPHRVLDGVVLVAMLGRSVRPVADAGLPLEVMPVHDSVRPFGYDDPWFVFRLVNARLAPVRSRSCGCPHCQVRSGRPAVGCGSSSSTNLSPVHRLFCSLTVPSVRFSRGQAPTGSLSGSQPGQPGLINGAWALRSVPPALPLDIRGAFW